MVSKTAIKKGIKYECRYMLELPLTQGGTLQLSPGDKVLVLTVGSQAIDIFKDGVTYNVLTRDLVSQIPTGSIFLI
jgi:hypothetical protein